MSEPARIFWPTLDHLDNVWLLPKFYRIRASCVKCVNENGNPVLWEILFTDIRLRLSSLETILRSIDDHVNAEHAGAVDESTPKPEPNELLT